MITTDGRAKVLDFGLAFIERRWQAMAVALRGAIELQARGGMSPTLLRPEWVER